MHDDLYDLRTDPGKYILDSALRLKDNLCGYPYLSKEIGYLQIGAREVFPTLSEVAWIAERQRGDKQVLVGFQEQIAKLFETGHGSRTLLQLISASCMHSSARFGKNELAWKDFKNSPVVDLDILLEDYFSDLEKSLFYERHEYPSFTVANFEDYSKMWAFVTTTAGFDMALQLDEVVEGSIDEYRNMLVVASDTIDAEAEYTW